MLNNRIERLHNKDDNKIGVILMRMLRRQVATKNKLCICVKFEPWRYHFLFFFISWKQEERSRLDGLVVCYKNLRQGN
jgi:hypothetical protein